MVAQASEETIELRVDDIAQLFHTLDPFPFREQANIETRPHSAVSEADVVDRQESKQGPFDICG